MSSIYSTFPSFLNSLTKSTRIALHSFIRKTVIFFGGFFTKIALLFGFIVLNAISQADTLLFFIETRHSSTSLNMLNDLNFSKKSKRKIPCFSFCCSVGTSGKSSVSSFQLSMMYSFFSFRFFSFVVWLTYCSSRKASFSSSITELCSSLMSLVH